MACLILSLTASLVMWSLYEMPSSFRKHLISVACNFFRISAVNVQVSRAYNSTEVTRERISLIFELREICLSLQMVFSLASVAAVCAILDSTSGLEPWSVTTAAGYLKLSTSSNLSRWFWCQCWYHSRYWSSVWSSLHWFPCQSLASSSSFPARPSMSSAKRKLVIVLPPMLTVPWWSSSASVTILSRKILKGVGESRHPYLTPTVVLNQSPMPPLR